MTRATIENTGNGFGSYPLQRVASTADGKPIFAKPLPDKLWHQNAGPHLPCAMTVYVKTGPDDYVAYGLSGAP